MLLLPLTLTHNKQPTMLNLPCSSSSSVIIAVIFLLLLLLPSSTQGCYFTSDALSTLWDFEYASAQFAGQCTSSAFLFHASKTSSIQTIQVWINNGWKGVPPYFSAMRVATFDGASFTMGEIPAYKATHEFTFAPGEYLEGDIIVADNGSKDPNHMRRFGYLKFTTSNQHTFEAGTLSSNPVYIPSNNGFLHGFYGYHGADVDALGPILTKPVVSAQLRNLQYHNLPSISSQTRDHVDCQCLIGPEAHNVTIRTTKSHTVDSSWSVEKDTTYGLEVSVSGDAPFLSASVTGKFELTTKSTQSSSISDSESTTVNYEEIFEGNSQTEYHWISLLGGGASSFTAELWVTFRGLDHESFLGVVSGNFKTNQEWTSLTVTRNVIPITSVSQCSCKGAALDKRVL